MAINKTINKSTKTHAAMRNCIEYVLQEHKTEQALVYVTGPAPEKVTYDSVYKCFLDEKKIWGKDSGRMYAHNIISWHKDEQITLQQALEFGKAFAEKWFQGFQTLIGVHKDRNHVHVHLVTNTVSYEDGHKLHNSRADLEKMKQFTNEMCRQRGLTVAMKGKDFYGKDLDEGHVIAWSKNKYHLLANDVKESHVAACAIACMEVMEDCAGKEEFIEKMAQNGWRVTWKNSRKNITFENEEGKKVRDSNISKTFHLNITKEALTDEFERQNQIRSNRESEEELEQYYRDIIAAVGGNGTGSADSNDGERQSIEAIITEPKAIPGAEKGMGREDTDAELRDGTDSGEKQSIRERLEVYREKVKQREQEQQLANQTYKRTRGRGR